MPNKICCKAVGCNKKAECRGLCQNHYKRWKNHGDYNRNLKDGFIGKHNKEYRIWIGMRQRCNNPKYNGYKDYGGRGIKVCERWNGKYDFKNFFEDMGECPKNYSLDRIDVNGAYCPENCRWVDWNTQASNKRNSRNRTSKYLGVSRLGNKWKAEIIVRGKRYYSIHEDEREAHRARQAMEKKYLGRLIELV